MKKKFNELGGKASRVCAQHFSVSRTASEDLVAYKNSVRVCRACRRKAFSNIDFYVNRTKNTNLRKITICVCVSPKKSEPSCNRTLACVKFKLEMLRLVHAL